MSKPERSETAAPAVGFPVTAQLGVFPKRIAGSGEAMKLIKQRVPADAVLRMINARLEAVQNAYIYAKGSDRTVEAEAMAETKWQLAELKMQFVDLLTEQVEARG